MLIIFIDGYLKFFPNKIQYSNQNEVKNEPSVSSLDLKKKPVNNRSSATDSSPTKLNQAQQYEARIN
jgi:hypothetical protein